MRSHVPSGGASSGGAAAGTENNANFHGLISVTHDPYLVNNEAAVPVAANLMLVKMAWEKTATVTTYMLWQGTQIGTVLTNCYLCLVDPNGNVLAPTADLSAGLMADANGPVSFNAVTPTIVPAQPGGWLWGGLQIGSATVMPGLGNWGSTLNQALTNFNVNGGALTRAGRVPTGNAALPGSIAPASIVGGTARLLIGVK